MNENTHLPLVQKMRESIEEDLRACLVPLRDLHGSEMVDMIGYHLGWSETRTQSSGKRIRPLLTLLCCAASGGEWSDAISVASAIELIHNFSLVHDDIEDNSATRRGQPTVWKKWGIPKAINLGDSIFVLSRLAAYRLSDLRIPPERIMKILRRLDKACLDLTIGQQLDLSFEEIENVELETYLRMIRGKTSALIAAAATCGGMVAGADDSIIKILDDYGHHLGLAFQIRDDILGIWGKPSITGKPCDDDLFSKKKTLPTLYGLKESQEFKELWKTERTENDIFIAMRHALEASKVRQYCDDKVESHTKLALSALSSLDGKDPYFMELTRLTQGLLARDQ